ncbi:hypothetical protein BJF90_15130 [Pseudonocardia sp. CNS-004]|nr:hypothetical protein BJF90_15130 [Pseudonocardia sp. CNS-004]
MSEWVAAVVEELGIEASVGGEVVDMVLDLTSDVAHGVSRPGAPVTAFLVGLAAGRAGDPAAAAREYAGKISALADRWDAGSNRPGRG